MTGDGEVDVIFNAISLIDLWQKQSIESKHCQLKASNDIEAINEWLTTYSANTNGSVAFIPIMI